MEVDMYPASKVIEFRPAPSDPDAKPFFERASWTQKQACNHDGATFLVSKIENRVTCSLCKQPVEAMAVLIRLLDREWNQARRDNADAWHRKHAEEEAEKQANKTRKAAYATLFRFGVTPEAYAEEYRRKTLLNQVELKQDYNQTLTFEQTS